MPSDRDEHPMGGCFWPGLLCRSCNDKFSTYWRRLQRASGDPQWYNRSKAPDKNDLNEWLAGRLHHNAYRAARGKSVRKCERIVANGVQGCGNYASEEYEGRHVCKVCLSHLKGKRANPLGFSAVDTDWLAKYQELLSR